MRRLFISDLHLNSRDLYERGFAWFRPKHHLSRILAYLRQQSIESSTHLDELVFLGDTFDTWLAPMDEVPPSYEDILDSNDDFVSLVREMIAHGTRVIITPGNHDFDLDEDALVKSMPGVVIAPDVHIKHVLYAAHGHELTFFNTTSHDPIEGRPLGYYFGRLTEERLPDGHSPAAVWSYVKAGALNGLNRPDMMGHIARTIFYDVAGLTPQDVFVLENGRTQTAQEVVDAYMLVAQEWSVSERLWRLLQRPTNLHATAWKLAKEHAVPLVVLGHCHHAHFTRMGPVLYANPGAWCQDRTHAVEVLMQGASAWVSLHEVTQDGSASVVRSRRV